MRHERFPQIHGMLCDCSRCDPTKTHLARLIDVIAPTNLHAVAIGLLAGLGSALLLTITKFGPAIVAALFS